MVLSVRAMSPRAAWAARASAALPFVSRIVIVRHSNWNSNYRCMHRIMLPQFQSSVLWHCIVRALSLTFVTQGRGRVAAAAAVVGQEHHSTFALITEAVHTLTISLP